MSTPSLLNCPCCSSAAKTQEIWAGLGMPTARVQCSSCGCMVEAKTDWAAMDMAGALARAIEQWNTRPAAAPPRSFELLRLARIWLAALIEAGDVEPAETAFNVAANGPQGSRPLARTTLANSLAEIDAEIKQGAPN